MAIITLTTDLGTKDYYVAAIKGAILSQIADIQIVDITHAIKAFDINRAAYIIKNIYHLFPKGSIHIIGVNDEISAANNHLAVFADGHYFVGADNGVFSLIFDQLNPDLIVDLNMMQHTNTFTFPSKDVFVPAACHIARGGTLEIIGRRVLNFQQIRSTLHPIIETDKFTGKESIKGAVIFTDNYGNAFTNIHKNFFEKSRKGRKFTILFGKEDDEITKISEKYQDVIMGDKLAIFGDNGMLEIAINKGRATDLLGLREHDYIRIEFL